MTKPKTHFEQVSLEVVKKNLEEELRLQTATQQKWGSINRFDIFQIESGGSMRWLETLEDMDDAKARIQDLGLLSPGEYIILDQQTGNKLVITVRAAAEAPWPSRSSLQAWEKLYREAREEGDPLRLLEKISAAESAIFQRLQKLDNFPDRKPEMMAMLDALAALFATKDEKLHWERLFHNLLLEDRPQELASKIQVTEAAIYKRLREMAHDSTDQFEREAIADAISNLRVLQTGCVSIPDSIDLKHFRGDRPGTAGLTSSKDEKASSGA
jgi:hypothetical protein